ncbi:MAG TPA: MerR family transcriptional regulator [Xanthobacteraceae bacterium]
MEKAPDAFRTISEVAQELDVPQHVLRFWESRFREIKPMKRGGGRRYYRPNDLDLLRGIRHLLYSEGYTIRGVQRLLREQGPRFVQSVWQEGAPPPSQQPAEAEPVREPPEARSHGVEPLLPGADAARATTRRTGEAFPPAGPVAPAPAGLGREELQRLEAVLRDLTECRRLLASALAEPV